MTNQVVALAKAARLQPRLGQNSDGQYVKTNAELNLGGRVLAREVLAMNLDGLAEKMGTTHLDGVLGANALQEFSAVRIDYKRTVIEFEK